MLLRVIHEALLVRNQFLAARSKALRVGRWGANCEVPLGERRPTEVFG